MIERDDYDASMAFNPPSEEMDDAKALPAPVGLVEIVCLVGLAGWSYRQTSSEREEAVCFIGDAR